MFSRSVPGALALLILAAVPHPAIAQTPDSVLVVEGTTLSDDGMATIHLHNEGTKTISAYTLIDSSDLREIVRVDYEAGLAMELLERQGGPPPNANMGSFHAGQSTTIRIGRHGNDFPLVRVAAVIFEDRTAIGDETLIEELFRDRSEEAAEYGRWCPSLAPEGLAGKDRAAVISLLAETASKIRAARPIQDAGNPVRQQLLNLLDQRSRPADPMILVTLIRAYCTTAATHSHRREAQ